MNTAARTHGNDSSHWYFDDGRPCYEMEKKDGSGMRPTTLADARKLNLLPSVTTILKVLAAPALQSWLIEQAVLAAMTTPRLAGEADDAFIQRVLHTERHQDQEAQKARDRGTEIHDGMEAMLQGKPVSDDLLPWIEPAYLHLKSKIYCVLKTECVLVGEGYAGRTDLVSDTSPNTVGAFLIADFKSTKKLPERGSWPEHRLQLAAYAAAAEPNLTAGSIRTANLYISTVERGKFAYYENPPWLPDYNQGFEPLVRHWQWSTQYAPKQTRPADPPLEPALADVAAD